jgi:glycosyltransferase involved in cell wall biosynthesis
MAFTLAICTFNRAALLEQALESLAGCERPGCDWELLLVDNNSSDATRSVAAKFESSLPLRYVFEPVQGLSSARNRALEECRSDVLLFTDDDLKFDPGWLRAYEQAFNAAPSAGWFGGRIQPLWPDGRPAWLRDEGMALIAGLMVRYDLGTQNRPYVATDPLPFGASFAMRRRAFESGGKFRTDLGVKGSTPGRGEEAEYLARLVRAGATGHYVGEQSAWHWQEAKRFRWAYLYRHGIQKGIAQVRIDRAPPQPAKWRWMEAVYGLKAMVQLAKGRGDRARQCVINMGISRGLRQTNGHEPQPRD